MARILVMDDDELVREVVTSMLGLLGYQGVGASDGRQALDCYIASQEQHDPFDVVLIDLTVRDGMGGMELMEKLLDFDPLAKGIVSSGYSMDPIMTNFTRHGFCGAMAKPYKMHDLDAAIKQILANPKLS